MFLGGGPGHDPEKLGYIADLVFPQIEDLAFRCGSQVNASKGGALVPDVTGGGQVGTVNAFQNSRLAGTRKANDPDEFALVQVHGNILAGVNQFIGVVKVEILRKALNG